MQAQLNRRRRDHVFRARRCIF